MPSDEQPPPAHVSVNGYRSHTYYIPTAAHERLKAAWFGSRYSTPGDPEAADTLGELVTELFEKEAARLEEKNNHGQPFPAAPRNVRGVSPQGVKRQGAHMTDLWRQRRDDQDS